MIKYLQFVIYSESTRTRVPDVWLENLKEYTTDKEKVVYWIPENSPEYDYAKGLCSRNLRNIVVEETGNSIIEYSQKEYDDANFYGVNFRSYIDRYDSVPIFENFGECCSNSSWKYVTGMVQEGNYRIPPKEFAKRKAGIMIPGFAVNEAIASALIEKGLATTEDFLEVYDKSRKKVVAYQIYPKHMFSGFCEDNNMRLVDSCSNCGMLRYEPNEQVYYISEETVKKLTHLNRTVEVTGPVIEKDIKEYDPKDDCSFVEPWIIVSKEVYEVMTSFISNKNFIPILNKR